MQSQDELTRFGVWFAPDKAGEHDIQCREYCGLIHYNMRGKLVVEDPIT
jgi:cytochrome c oxidase subunit 2